MKKIKILFPEFLEMIEKLRAAGIWTRDYRLVVRYSTDWTKEDMHIMELKVRAAVFPGSFSLRLYIIKVRVGLCVHGL